MALDQNTLQKIVEGTAAATGTEFFDHLVKHLADAVGTKCAWVTEWFESVRRLRALSFWAGNGYFGDFEYSIDGTACAQVIDNRRLFHVPDRVVELYRADPSLRDLGAVSYMGVPLFDTDDRILGHLALLHDAPLAADPDILAIFGIFASRAAAELRRVRRDRDLREREQKLSRLIESAMDAIVELDGDLHITSINTAGEKIFGCSAADAKGRAFEAFLTQESRGKLIYLIGELARQPEGRRSLWIPGLDAIRTDGEMFLAEATLSRFELDGRPYHALILRDVHERLAAEERIRALTSEAGDLRAEIDAMRGFDAILGESEALRRLLVDVDRVAVTDATVLITGETGTGKELIANAIHRRSPRADKRLVTVNCASIPASLQESEFFGHERGAFTGATQRRDGRFKTADGGTLFLDEVGELPMELQAKLLRVLQEGEFEPVGSSRSVRVDVRIVAATNRDLEQMVREGTFRQDLLYRLNVFPLHMPPLRERGDDIVLLADAFARSLARQSGRPVPALTPSCKEKLKHYAWPGNVRELHNVIERAFITSTDPRRLDLDRALPESRPAASARGVVDPGDAPPRVLTEAEMQDLERENIRRALVAAGWKVSGRGGAAERLAVKPNTLASRIRALGIQPPKNS